MGMTIINNYEMPSNCYMCDLHNYHECDLTGESIEEDYCWNGDSREKHCPLREVEAIPKDQYEARLKADLVAMLENLDLQIDESASYNLEVAKVQRLIRNKINALRGEKNETDKSNK